MMTPFRVTEFALTLCDVGEMRMASSTASCGSCGIECPAVIQPWLLVSQRGGR